MGSSTGNAFERLRKEAKRLLKAVQSGDEAALRRFTQYWPASGPSGEVRNLVRTQLVIARERGYRSWAHLKTSLLPKKERVMETEFYTKPYAGREGFYKFTHLKWRVEARERNCDCSGKPTATDERITVNLDDSEYRVANRSDVGGFVPFIVHMSIEEAEELQAQLAKAIGERRRADSEAKGKGSEKSS
ncbi:MAG: hypothetical protein ACOYOU_17890 [Kiritimatiellia bacterium]